MNPKVMDAVGLIGRYVADSWEHVVDPSVMLDELEAQGFSTREISDAFRWIERNTLGADEVAVLLPEATRPSMRILSVVERTRVTPEAQGVLQRLHDRGLIDTLMLEEMVEKALKSDDEEIGANEMRRIASLTIFNRVQDEWKDFLKSTNTLVH